LDDTFIITGAYFRTDPLDPMEDRIRDVMQEVGWSISLTTLTTIFAFTLGYFSSSFPGVHWLCLSAVTTIAIDFFFQITYFVAWLVLDERRMQARKRDCCFWMDIRESDAAEEEEEEDDEEAMEEAQRDATEERSDARDEPLVLEDTRALPEKLMSWYADILLKPAVKIVVLVVFGLFFVVCCFSASSMTQEFDVGSYVTEDSYLRNIFTSLNEYSTVVRPMALYFRHVDQSDPELQQQMIRYVTEMESLPRVLSLDNDTLAADFENGSTGIEEVRPFCWVRDFEQLNQQLQKDEPLLAAVLNNWTFEEKVEYFLQDPIVREVYGQDLVRDEEGRVVASRCYLFLQDLDLKDVEAQIDMLFDQREVTLAQPINQMEEHQKDWAFFAYDELFGYWEAYSVSVDELVFTMIAGVVAVTFISFVFIPHWTGAPLVCPLIIVLYINMLGSLNFLGLHINGITYVCVVVSIGLLVDFLIHVLLRYYECKPGLTRDERVKETLETMGASILVGGVTTFLAVVPIAASSVKIFLTVFNSFFAMVFLGVSHGLILLPVVLSLVGPTTNVRHVGMDHEHEREVQEEVAAPRAKAVPEGYTSNGSRTLASMGFDFDQEIDVDTFMEESVPEVYTSNRSRTLASMDFDSDQEIDVDAIMEELDSDGDDMQSLTDSVPRSIHSEISC